VTNLKKTLDDTPKREYPTRNDDNWMFNREEPLPRPSLPPSLKMDSSLSLGQKLELMETLQRQRKLTEPHE